MSLSKCLKVARDISDADNAALLSRVDVNRSLGMDANEAARAAAADMLAGIRHERDMTVQAVREQHPDLFGKEPKKSGRSKLFTNPDEYQAEARMKRRDKGEVIDEKDGTEPVKPGQPFIVYRVGQGNDLENRNAGSAAAIGRFLTRLDGDGPMPAGSHDNAPTTITAYKVTLTQPFGAYEHGKQGAPLQQRTVGRQDETAGGMSGIRSGVVYSFPAKGAYKAEQLGAVPIAKVRELAQQLHGYEDFDDMGGNLAASVVREAFAQQYGGAEDVRFARTTTPGAPGTFQLKPFGIAGRIIEAIQDRYNRWKQVITTVEKQGGVVTEANDFYRAEERYWGRVATRIEDFDHELDDFLGAIAADNLTIKDVQTWAYAKHAFERNEYLRDKRQAASGFDAWSGMSDADAQALIDDATNAGLDVALERHRQTLQGWVQGTRDIMLADGLITPTEHATLSKMFTDYVPLRGLKDADGNDVTSTRTGTGSGFDVRGKETKRTKGRYSEADHIIENIIQDRTRTLIRSGKNEVLRSFLQFVVDNPSDNLWEINAVEHKPIFSTDAAGNQVIDEQPAIIKDDRTVSIKDGGREVYVQIKDKPLLEQLKNLNSVEVGRLMGIAMMGNRVLSRLYTSLSPVFTVLNGLRDAQEAAINMVGETGFRGSAKLLAGIPGALVQGMRAEFGSPSADYQAYRSSGGKTGFFDFKTIDAQAKDLQKRLANAERSSFNPRVWGPGALHLIEKINGGVENATRLSAFLAARSEGKSVAEAAHISKNISVNFNRKGTMANGLGALWLFYNPAVQGTARTLQALRSPKVLATLGAGMAGIAALAFQNASMGDDDDGVAWWDKVPNEIKDRNLIIMLPPGSKAGESVPGTRVGRYIKIPMPYGYSFFASVANNGVDVWRHAQDPARGRKAGEATMKLVGAFLQAYMPSKEIGNATENPKALVMAMVPDLFNAFAQSLLNINSFGRQMYPEDEHNPNAPDSTKYFASQAGTVFQKSAQKLNEWTGGSKFTSGALDLTPATIENLVRSYGGGPAAFALDLLNAEYARQSIKRTDLDVRRLPFVKQLYGQIDAETDRMAGFDRMNEIASKVDPIKAASKAGDNAEAAKLYKEAGPIANLGGALIAARQSLSQIRKAELAVINSSHDDERKYADLMVLSVKKRQVEQQLNRAYNAAQRSSVKAAVPQPVEE